MMSGSASLANSTIGVGQLLAAIGMNISIVQTQSHKLDSAGARAISENAMLVEEVSREIRTISRLFHPQLLDHAALVWGWFLRPPQDQSGSRYSVRFRPSARRS